MLTMIMMITMAVPMTMYDEHANDADEPGHDDDDDVDYVVYVVR